jgi:uncharacterized protein
MFLTLQSSGKTAHLNVNERVCMRYISSTKIITIVVMVFIAIPFLAISGSAETQSFTPSFDCLQATSKIEETICTDQKLAGLDVELNSIYKKLFSSLPEPEKVKLKNEQLAWLKNRDKSCDSLKNVLVCVTDAYLQRIEALKKEDDRIRNENITSYQNKYDFRELTFGDIVGNDNILKDLYSFREEEVVTINKKDISLSLYTVKYDELVFNDLIPKSIIIVKSESKETRLPIEAYQPLTEIEYSIPVTKSPVILIKNPRGGNGWNSNPYYVISLEREYFLKNIGQVSTYRDLNHDGFEELISFDDIWEIGLGLLSHADSPGAIIVLSVENGKVSPDIKHYTNYYLAEIKRLNGQIIRYPKSLPPEVNGQLLSNILQKFLIYRLLNDEVTGWKEFNEDIRHYDKVYFFLNSSGNRIEKVSIDEITNKMKKSLEKNSQT